MLVCSMKSVSALVPSKKQTKEIQEEPNEHYWHVHHIIQSYLFQFHKISG